VKGTRAFFQFLAFFTRNHKTTLYQLSANMRAAFQLQIHNMLEAARVGHEDIVARLFSIDPSLVDARTTDGYRLTPLHLAATNSHDGVIAQLLAFSPQTSDARDSEGRTALHLAAAKGHDKIVGRLLAHNPALINASSNNGQMALHFAAWEGHESTVVQLLNHSPGLLDMKTATNTTALHLAAFQGHVKVVAQLLARRPSLGAEDWMGRTPLFCAASQGDQEVVDLFPLTTDQVLCLHTPHSLPRCSYLYSTLLSLSLSLSYSLSLSLSLSLFFLSLSLFVCSLGASPRQIRQHSAAYGYRR